MDYIIWHTSLGGNHMVTNCSHMEHYWNCFTRCHFIFCTTLRSRLNNDLLLAGRVVTTQSLGAPDGDCIKVKGQGLRSASSTRCLSFIYFKFLHFCFLSSIIKSFAPARLHLISPFPSYCADSLTGMLTPHSQSKPISWAQQPPAPRVSPLHFHIANQLIQVQSVWERAKKEQSSN